MPSGISLMGLLAGAAASTVLTGMMGGDRGGSPSAPSLTPPTEMPNPGDAAAKAAERASIAEQLRRRGRASTILTDQTGDTTDKLGA